MVTFKDKILHKVIGRELISQQGCSDQEFMLNIIEQSGMPIRNVCVRMHAADKAQLEAVASVLDMKLQEFVSDAIREAIGAALGVMEERGMMEWFGSEFEERLAAEELRLVPDPDSKGRFTIERIKDETKEAE